MKREVVMAGVLGAVLLGTVVSHAEKWDKNRHANNAIESAFYDVDSIKVVDRTLSWTEKYILTGEGAKAVTSQAIKHQVCKDNVAKKGNIAQTQVDMQIEGQNIRQVAIRHYNKDSALICSEKDMGHEFDASWKKITPRSPMQQTKNDLITKYKVKLP